MRSTELPGPAPVPFGMGRRLGHCADPVHGTKVIERVQAKNKSTPALDHI